MGTRNVYVISDLHLGGAPAGAKTPGFQMCPPDARRRLARFIAHIARARKGDGGGGGDVELVVNGDFVDFLAETPFEAFTSGPGAAATKLARIIASCDAGAPAGEGVFPALWQFVADGYALTLLLGNHDIELGLPEVRHALLDYLTKGRPARIEILADGEACRRGDVLIEHGNRYDGWNAVAHGELRAFRARASRGEPPFPFSPPAGSRLVTEVMNPLKALYRFIDLLKPENEAVIPILCALHPSAAREIRKVFDAWRAKSAATPGQVPERETYIGGYGDVDAAVVPDALTRIGGQVPAAAVARAAGGPVVHAAVAPGPRPAFAPSDALRDEVDGDPVDAATLRRTEALLANAEAQLRELERRDGDVVPEALAQVGDGSLAWLRSTYSLLRMGRAEGAERYQRLRDALAAHREAIGSTFALGTEDPHYLEAARRLAAGGIRHVIFGHTHVAKWIGLKGGGAYVNTGTWCPTIRLDPRLYDRGANDDEARALLQSFVEDLGANRLGAWTTLQTPFARIGIDAAGRTEVELCEFGEEGRVTRLAGSAP